MTAIKIFISLLIVITVFSSFSHPDKKDKSKELKEGSKVLVLSFGDQFQSNYYPKSMIADKANLGLGEFSSFINEKFINSFTVINNSKITYVTVEENEVNNIRKLIRLKGEDEEIYTDISMVSDKDYDELMKQYNADYLMVFSQYYLKWQEEPFNTLFHIFNFNIYTQDKKEVYEGKSYFNTFSLNEINNIDKLFEKNIKKNASTFERAIKNYQPVM